jgi:hypothetical protein
MTGKGEKRSRRAATAGGAIARVVLSALGILLMAWGIGSPLLALFGAEAEGRITYIRRQLGDRGEALPNRYAYAITYEFRLPDGTVRAGTSQRIGDFFSPGRLGVGSRVSVHYAPFAPSLSAMDWRIGSLIENIVVVTVGALLVWLPLRRR